MNEQQAVARGRPAWWPVWILAGTILLGAFLLFQVQPLISKCILPWFGGCPAVWTTAMLFFQTLLFGGYVYAHLLQRRLSVQGQAVVHVVLVAAALLLLLLLPIAPRASWKPPDSSAPTWRILLLLTATVGLPYFVLSATSPLVQAWFSRSQPGRSPYRLYALSNFGSLAALLSYPFFFEWVLGVKWQSILWSWTFVLYGVLCGVCLISLWLLRGPGTTPVRPGAVVAEAVDPPTAGPTWPQRLLWVALPACGSLMLLAATNHVCQDVAVVPFLWVVPLALYLLSFIICFDHQRWYVRGLWAPLALAAIVWVADSEIDLFPWLEYKLSFVQELVLYFAALFFVCMVCHGELVRLRPDPRHLTEFYLLIAAGGALGGAAVSLVAPQIFNRYFEWQIGLGLSAVIAWYALTAAVLNLAGARGAWRWLAHLPWLPAAVIAAGFLGWRYSGRWPAAADAPPFYAAIFERIDSAIRDPALERTRNFYGTVAVLENDADDAEAHAMLLQHGVITHGRQFVAEHKRRIATTYYNEESGVGQAIEYFRQRGRVRVGVVGLGIGTLATYARPGDQYRFYEINPEIVRLAEKENEKERYFTYLHDCRGEYEIVMGDARLSLEREQPQHFDLLVLDAFSSDSIPNHLLTAEAMEIYLRHVPIDSGVIAIHISNRYLYLAPVVRGLAEHCRLKTVRIWSDDDEERLVYRSDWMLLTRNEAFLGAVPESLPANRHDDFTVPLWTDQYNNLFQILIRRED